MFDIDSGKLLIVAVLALIVIGPKELPRVLRQVGQTVGKLRRMAGEFQGQFMDAMKEADIADIRKELDDLNKAAAVDVAFDPVRDIRTELDSALEPLAVSASESAAPSPAAGFDLPKIDDAADLGSIGSGIAPLIEGQREPVPARLDDLEASVADHSPGGFNGHDFAPAATPAKRRILVKRRTSRLNVLQADAVAQSTGEPLLVRRRVVRAKSATVEDAPSA